MPETPDSLPPRSAAQIAAEVLDHTAALKRRRAAELMNQPHVEMRRWAEIDEATANTIRELDAEATRLRGVEVQAKKLTGLLATEVTQLEGQVKALLAENDACWDAVAGMADYLTDDQIMTELGRRGVQVERATERVRAARDRAKTEPTS